MNDGRVWASCSEGLFEWKGDTVLSPPAVQHPAFLQPFLDIGVLADWQPGSVRKGMGWLSGARHRRRDGNRGARRFVVGQGVCPARRHRRRDLGLHPPGPEQLTPLGGRRYRIDNFTVKHGLPSNTVNDVTTTAGGDVWVATAKGLFRLREEPESGACSGSFVRPDSGQQCRVRQPKRASARQRQSRDPSTWPCIFAAAAISRTVSACSARATTPPGRSPASAG